MFNVVLQTYGYNLLCHAFVIILGLTQFLQCLDNRANSSLKESKKHVPERKQRFLSDTLRSLLPSEAPAWTINKEWLRGMHQCYLLCQWWNKYKIRVQIRPTKYIHTYIHTCMLHTYIHTCMYVCMYVCTYHML